MTEAGSEKLEDATLLAFQMKGDPEPRNMDSLWNLQKAGEWIFP